MRIRPQTDFTRGMTVFVWKRAEDVVLRKDKPVPVGKGRNVRGSKKAKTKKGRVVFKDMP